MKCLILFSGKKIRKNTCIRRVLNILFIMQNVKLTIINTPRFSLYIGLLFVIFGNKHFEARVFNCYKNGLCQNRMQNHILLNFEEVFWKDPSQHST